MAFHSSPYGVTISNRTGKHYTDPQVLQDAVNLGLGWIRYQIAWANIETTKGVYNATAIDTIDDTIKRCAALGLSVQFVIQQPPPWQTSKSGCGSCANAGGNSMCWNGQTDSAFNDGQWHPHDPTNTANFTDFLSKRYNGITNISGYGPLYIDAYEIGNEEMDNMFDPSQPTTSAGQKCRQAALFIPVLQKCSPIIRANTANSPQGQALVGMCSLWWEDSQHHKDFMQALYDNGCKSLFDYANIHFYSTQNASGAIPPPDQNTNATRLSLDGQVGEVWQVMNANGDGAKDVWVTEIGWDVPVSGGYEINDDPTQGAGPYRVDFYTSPLKGVSTGKTSADGAFELMRKGGHTGVVNFFTMNYTNPTANAGSQAFSLTQFNAPHYTASFGAVQQYIKTYPTWDDSAPLLQARDLAARVRLKTASAVLQARDLVARTRLRLPGGSTQVTRDIGGRAIVKQLAHAGTPRVLIVLMENRSYAEVIGNANWPNLNALATTYAFATNCYAIRHPSLPNYLSLISGSTQGVTNDNPPGQNGPFGATTFADELQTASIPWKAYFEGYPSVGYTGGDTGKYAVRHNPFVYFNNIINDATKKNKLVPATQLTADLAASSPPAFLWYTPDVNDDGHDTVGTSFADTWLANPTITAQNPKLGFIQQVQASNWYAGGGRIIIVWDESLKTDTVGIGDATPGGGRIVCVVVAEAAKNAANLASNLNLYGILRGLCLLYGVTPLANSAHTSNGDITPLLGTNSQAVPMDFRGRVRLQPPGRARDLAGRVRLTLPVSLTTINRDMEGRVRLGAAPVTNRARDLAGRVRPAALLGKDLVGRARFQALQATRTRDLSARVRLVYAQDTCTRANQSGWGTNADGLAWVKASGVATPSIVGNQAKITGGTGNGVVMRLGSASISDGEGLVRFSTSDTGNAPSLVLRSDSAAANYCRAAMKNGALTITKVVSGVSNDLGSTPAIISTNTPYWLRFRVQGAKLLARYWADGSLEPPGWSLVVDGGVYTNGSFGLRCQLSTTVSGQSAVFDSFAVFSPLYPTLAASDLTTRVHLCDDQDTFNRPPISSSWGTSTTGSSWLQDGAFSTTGTDETSGLIASSSSGMTYEVLGQGVAADAEVTTQLSVGAVADTAGILIRYQSISSWYAAAFTNTTFALLANITGTLSTLVAQSFVAQPGNAYNLHVRLKNTGLFASLWPAGTAEPPGFLLQAVDSNITNLGQWGLVGNASTAAAITYDNFVALALSKLVSQDIGARVNVQTVASQDIGARVNIRVLSVTQDLAGRARLRYPPTAYDVVGRVRLAVSQDTFVRANTAGSTTVSNAAGWGLTASDGETWVATGGAGATYSIASNAGSITGATGNTSLLLGTLSLADAEGLVRTSVSSTSNGVGIEVRATGTSTLYRADLLSGVLNIQKFISGVATDLIGSPPSFTVTVGTKYWLRFRIIGSNLAARAWQDGVSEPTTWLATATDTAIAAGTSGQWGLRSKLNTAGDTNTFDSFVVIQGLPTVAGLDLAGRMRVSQPVTLSRDQATRVRLAHPPVGLDLAARVRLIRPAVARDLAARVRLQGPLPVGYDILGRVNLVDPSLLFPSQPGGSSSLSYYGESVIPVIPSGLYMVNGVALDAQPIVCTAPLGLSGNILLAGSTFELLFTLPQQVSTVPTSTLSALADGSVVSMTFALPGGRMVTGEVQVASTVTNRTFSVVCTLVTPLTLSDRVIATPFF